MTRMVMQLAAASMLAVSVASTVVAQPLPADATVRRSLVADTIIAGVPCARTEGAPAEFHRSDRLAGCFVSREHAIGTHRFPRGSWLDFNAAGTLWGAWLSADATLAGHRCRGEGFKKWSVRFHPNGALASCYLTADAVVDGVPCMRGTFLRELRTRGRTALQLADDGRLLLCIVARDTLLDGRAIQKWTLIDRRASAPVSAARSEISGSRR